MASYKDLPGYRPGPPPGVKLPPGVKPEDFAQFCGGILYLGSLPMEEALPYEEPDPAEKVACDWVASNAEIQERYGGLIVVVKDFKVWGAGRTYRAAWEDAQKKPDCPARNQVFLIVV